MQAITVLLLALIGIFLAGLMLKQGFSRTVDLFSLRNLYLFSFIVYQIVSPALVLYYGQYVNFKISSPVKTGKTFLLYVFVFTILFLFSYHRLKFTNWLARRGVTTPREINDVVYLILAFFMVFVAVVLRFYAIYIPGIKNLSTQIGIAIAAVASAIAGWVWGNRRMNIPVTLAAVAITTASLTVAMVGSFGRRPMIAVLLGFAWGAYHRRFKFMKPSKAIYSVMPLLLIVAVGVSAFTAVRQNTRATEDDVGATFGQMKKAEVTSGAKDLLGGQAVGAAALWTVEEWPDRREPRMLYSLQYMAYWWVPRVVWPDKPLPLGNDIARFAKLKGVNWDRITLPPGVIGYATAEGGWIAVVIYALFYGQFLKFFDELLRLNPSSSFVVLPVGCAAAQVLGLARGCIAVFANLIIIGFLSTFVFLYVASRVFGNRQASQYWNAWSQTHPGS